MGNLWELKNWESETPAAAETIYLGKPYIYIIFLQLCVAYITGMLLHSLHMFVSASLHKHGWQWWQLVGIICTLYLMSKTHLHQHHVQWQVTRISACMCNKLLQLSLQENEWMSGVLPPCNKSIACWHCLLRILPYQYFFFYYN